MPTATSLRKKHETPLTLLPFLCSPTAFLSLCCVSPRVRLGALTAIDPTVQWTFTTPIGFAAAACDAKRDCLRCHWPFVFIIFDLRANRFWIGGATPLGIVLCLFAAWREHFAQGVLALSTIDCCTRDDYTPG
jgi:hypothetical protein